MRAPRTVLSTELRSGRHLLKTRLRDLYSPGARRGRGVLLLAVCLTLCLGALVSCREGSPPSPDTRPTEAELEVFAQSYIAETARRVERGSYMVIDPLLEDVVAHPSTAQVLDGRVTDLKYVGEVPVEDTPCLLYRVSCELLFDKPEEVGRAGAVYEADDGWLGGFFSSQQEYMVLRWEEGLGWTYTGAWQPEALDREHLEGPETIGGLEAWLSAQAAAYRGEIPPLSLTAAGEHYLLRDGVWEGAVSELTPTQPPESADSAMTFALDGPFQAEVPGALETQLHCFALPAGNALGEEVTWTAVAPGGTLLPRTQTDYAVVCTAVVPDGDGTLQQFRYLFKLVWP